MKRRPRRNHTPAFKAKVAIAAIKAIGRLRSLRSSSTFIPTRSQRGKRSSKTARPTFSVPPARRGKAAEPVVDVKALHVKIGELTLELIF
jgi:transposase